MIFKENHLNEFAGEFYVVADVCFYCTKPLSLPAFVWHGCGCTADDSGYIWFHPKCAKEFVAKVLIDLEKI